MYYILSSWAVGEHWILMDAGRLLPPDGEALYITDYLDASSDFFFFTLAR